MACYPVRAESSRAQFPSQPTHDFNHVHHGDGPIVAVAIHDGREVRAAGAEHLAISDAARLHEEDAHTSRSTSIAPTRVIGLPKNATLPWEFRSISARKIRAFEQKTQTQPTDTQN